MCLCADVCACVCTCVVCAFLFVEGCVGGMKEGMEAEKKECGTGEEMEGDSA